MMLELKGLSTVEGSNTAHILCAYGLLSLVPNSL